MANGSLQKIKVFKSSLNSLTERPTIFTGNTSIETFEANMPVLTSTYDMFAGCSSLGTYKGNLDSVTDTNNMFYGTSLSEFEGNLSSLTNGSNMFNGCSKLEKFTCQDLSKLTDGSYMFSNCAMLEEFDSSDLPSLVNGSYMFNNCTKLTFRGTDVPEMSSLENAEGMFYASGISGFSAPESTEYTMPSLTNCTRMFYGCPNFGMLDGIFSEVTDATEMCCGCVEL
jgi:hypothetical protein